MDIFNHIVNKYKQRLCGVKELKFSFIYPRYLNPLLRDLISQQHDKMSIHIEKGTEEPPSKLIQKILSNNIHVDKNIEKIIITDKNFFLNRTDKNILRKQNYKFVEKESHKVPGIQIADIIAGTFRKYDIEKINSIYCIYDCLCEYSKRLIAAPGVR